jgi:hypothetical protein
MNWGYIISGVIAEVGLLTLVYNLTARRSDATIKALEAHNKWLENQLREAKEKAPDFLVKTLSERASAQEAELKRLSTDRQADKEVIAEKEAELRKTKDLLSELKKAVDDFQEKYDELRSKTDLCPYCEAMTVELKEIREGNWVGSYQRYACGYTIQDGDQVYFCPSAPEYPSFDELKIWLQQDVLGSGWTATFEPRTEKARMIEPFSAHGATKEEATQNLRAAYYQNPAKE